jgi:hypothetical protein
MVTESMQVAAMPTRERIAFLLALAVLVLPGGIVVVCAIWIYRYLRALLSLRASRSNPVDSQPSVPPAHQQL